MCSTLAFHGSRNHFPEFQNKWQKINKFRTKLTWQKLHTIFMKNHMCLRVWGKVRKKSKVCFLQRKKVISPIVHSMICLPLKYFLFTPYKKKRKTSSRPVNNSIYPHEEIYCVFGSEIEASVMYVNECTEKLSQGLCWVESVSNETLALSWKWPFSSHHLSP